MSPPTVTFESLDQFGVYLMPSTAPEFAAALNPQRSPAGDALLPYAVLLRNDSDRDMIAWSVRWQSVSETGKIVHQQNTEWNFPTLRPEDGILAHQARIVSMPSGVLTQARGNREDERQIAQMAEFYGRQSSVVVSIDAVIFDDGSAIGPDVEGSVPRLKARLDAERDLAAEVMGWRTSAGALGPLKDRLADIKEAALRLVPPDAASRRYSFFPVAANRAKTYDEAYALMKGFFAAQLSDLLEKRGEAAAIETVTSFASARKYPNVHREPTK